MHKIYLSLLLLLVGTISNLSAQITFEKTYGGTFRDVASAVKQTTDGGYIIGGGLGNVKQFFNDAYLIKTDANGDTIWTKSYGNLGGEFVYSLLQTKDGGYVMCGSNSDFKLFGTNKIYLFKTDANGDTLWVKNIVGLPGIATIGNSIQQTSA